MKPNYYQRILAAKPKVAVEEFAGDTVVVDHKDEIVPNEAPPAEIPDPVETNPTIANIDIPEDEDFASVVEEKDFTDTIKTYEGVVDVIEKNKESGISMEAATFLNLFAEKEGLPISMYVSNESYSVLGQSQTAVALEGFKEVIREWWTRFREWLKAMGQHMEQWAQRVLTGADRLVSRAQIILDNAEDRIPGDDRIKSSRIGKLAIDGQVNDVPRHLRDLANICRASFMDLQQQAIDHAKGIASVVASTDATDAGSVGNAADKIRKIIEEPTNSLTSFMKKTEEPSLAEILLRGNNGIVAETLVSDKLLGNCTLAAVVVKAQEADTPDAYIRNVANAVRNSRIEFLDDSEESKKWNMGNSGVSDEEENEFNRLSATDCRAIAESVKNIGEILRGLDGLVSDRNSAMNEINRAGSRLQNTNGDEDAKDLESTMSSLRTITSTVASRLSGPTTKLASYFGNMARISLEYAEKSLKAKSTDLSGMAE
ncbi:hypothetical protein TOTORO_02860 [Serratia phage vB_SmaS-Totoro]|nr:hypothetical protein TOTORO_02860 [Serratia phage vB_SmaS-Totoro]